MKITPKTMHTILQAVQLGYGECLRLKPDEIPTSDKVFKYAKTFASKTLPQNKDISNVMYTVAMTVTAGVNFYVGKETDS